MAIRIKLHDTFVDISDTDDYDSGVSIKISADVLPLVIRRLRAAQTWHDSCKPPKKYNENINEDSCEKDS